MKKTSIFLGLVAMGFFASAQNRTTLFEEFTGENCGPCAATNPALNTLLTANASSVIAIKWQVPIPSAPTTTWSLYLTNKAEIDWRAGGASGYNYPSQYTPTYAVTNGINSAPSGRLDGQHQWAFGAVSDHPGNLSGTHITAAASVTTPFSIAMTTSWSPTFTNCVVTVTVTSSAAFTASGTLVYRLCLIERLINFPSAPGSNGETTFEDVVRKSYPTTGAPVLTSMGTNLPGTWIAGQTQTLSINCNIPTYINDAGQMAFVGFVQDDGNKRVLQAKRTAQPAIPNDAKAMSVSVQSVICSSTISPSATILNNGVNAITAMTITPYMNGTAGTPVVWTGNLAVAASTTIAMGISNPVSGNNTYSINVTGVSGGDVVLSNNGASSLFLNTLTYAAGAVTEGFVGATFPPTNWASFNPSGAPYTWIRSTSAGGFAASSESARVFINWTTPNGYHDLFLPGASLSGTTNPAVKFDLSYCMIDATSNDKLELLVSTDCGATWNAAWSKVGAQMSTTPFNNASLNTPTTAAQWTLITVPLTTYSNNATVLIKFKATAGSSPGNSVWLDNINLYQNTATGIEASSLNASSIDLYPNPATSETNVNINSANNADVKISVVNFLGQVVYNKQHSLTAGANTIKLDCKDLAEGVYIVSMESNKNTITKKLVVSK